MSSFLIGGASRAASVVACASPRVIARTARMLATNSSVPAASSILSSSSVGGSSGSSGSSVGGSSSSASGRIYTALTPELAEAASVCIADTFSQQSDPFTWLFNLKRHHWFSLVIPFIERAAHGAFSLPTLPPFAAFVSFSFLLLLHLSLSLFYCQ